MIVQQEQALWSASLDEGQAFSLGEIERAAAQGAARRAEDIGYYGQWMREEAVAAQNNLF